MKLVLNFLKGKEDRKIFLSTNGFLGMIEMLNVIKKRLRPEKGQVLVFSILLLPLVLGILALVVEMGNLYVHYWQLQSAADITAVAVTRNMTAIAIRRECATIYREVAAVYRVVDAVLRTYGSNFDSMTEAEKNSIAVSVINDFYNMTPEKINAIEINVANFDFNNVTDAEKNLIAKIVADEDEENGEKVFFDNMAEEKRNLIVETAIGINCDYMTNDEKDFIVGIITNIDFDNMQEREKTLIEEIANEIEKTANETGFVNLTESEKDFISDIVAEIDFDNMAEWEKSRIAGIANKIFANETDFDNVTEEEKELITKIANMSNVDNIKKDFPIKSFKPSVYLAGSNKFYVKLEKDVETFFERVFKKDGISPVPPLSARAAASIDTTNLKSKLTAITKQEIEVIEPSWIEVEEETP